MLFELQSPGSRKDLSSFPASARQSHFHTEVLGLCKEIYCLNYSRIIYLRGGNAGTVN